MGRFINADGYISTGQGLLGSNVFTYCQNNPINFCDKQGQFALLSIGGMAILSLCVIAISYCFTVSTISLINNLSTPAISYSKSSLSKKEETLPRQGRVSEDPDAPPVDAGKQGKHVPGHNNHDPSKSSWPKGKNGVKQTQEAWKNGTPDPKKPDGSVRIGTASDGTVVRVHQNAEGFIHGYPIDVMGVIVGVLVYGCINELSNGFLEVGWDDLYRFF